MDFSLLYLKSCVTYMLPDASRPRQTRETSSAVLGNSMGTRLEVAVAQV